MSNPIAESTRLETDESYCVVSGTLLFYNSNSGLAIFYSLPVEKLSKFAIIVNKLRSSQKKGQGSILGWNFVLSTNRKTFQVCNYSQL